MKPKALRSALRGGALLLALEIALRLLDPAPFAFGHAFHRVFAYSPRWNVDLIPSRTAHLWIDDAEGAPFLNFIVTTSEHGFRTYDRPADHGGYEATAGEPRPKLVHAVGDSMTMGWGVDYASSYPAILDWLLPADYRVLNLGVAGFGVIAATEKSMSLAGRFPPQHAILLVTPNDFEDDEAVVALARRSRPYHWLRLLNDALRRRSYLADLPFVVKRQWRFRQSRPLGPSAGPKRQSAERLAERGIVLRVDPTRLPTVSGDHPSLRQISRYRDFLDARGARLSVLVLLADRSWTEAARFYRYCRDQGIDVEMIVAPDEMRLREEGHLNAMGHQALAALAREKVLEGGPGPDVR